MIFEQKTLTFVPARKYFQRTDIVAHFRRMTCKYAMDDTYNCIPVISRERTVPDAELLRPEYDERWVRVKPRIMRTDVTDRSPPKTLRRHISTYTRVIHTPL